MKWLHFVVVSGLGASMAWGLIEAERLQEKSRDRCVLRASKKGLRVFLAVLFSVNMTGIARQPLAAHTEVHTPSLVYISQTAGLVREGTEGSVYNYSMLKLAP